MTIALLVLVYLTQLITTIAVTNRYINKGKQILADTTDDKRRVRVWLTVVQWAIVWFAIFFITKTVATAIIA